MRRAGWALAAALLWACGEESYDPPAPQVRAFRVELTEDFPRGTPDDPLPFPSAIPARVPVKLTALGPDGAPFVGYQGVARLDVAPGVIPATGRRVRFVDGEAKATAEIRFAYGPTRIWVEDVGEDPAADCANEADDDGDGLADVRDPDCQKLPDAPAAARATLATGISETLHFAPPRIRDLQFSPRCTTDTPLGGENVTIDHGTLIVTGTTQSGMYVTDLAGEPGGYNSVYLFTFSNPGDVRRGDRLCSIAGNAAEFIGNTQLNFPSFVNADTNRNGRIDEDDLVPCDLPRPDLGGPEAVPDPVVLTPAHVNGELGEVPAEFYLYCLPGDEPVPGLADPTDCQAARRGIERALGRERARRSRVDCRRDNFAMEPWEHALVAFDDVTVSTRFEVCDTNGDERIDRSPGSPEGACEEDCNADPLCTIQLSLKQYGQFGAGLGCTGAGDAVTCAAKIYVATRDTLGGSGYDAQAHAGERYARVVGHLRQTQPGAGVETIWIVEPRFIEDFIRGEPQP